MRFTFFTGGRSEILAPILNEVRLSRGRQVCLGVLFACPIVVNDLIRREAKQESEEKERKHQTDQTECR